MNKNNIILLKTLVLSSSNINKIRNSKDKKVRNKAITGLIGALIIYLLIIAYSVLACIGYGQIGLAGDIPVIFVATITVLAFFFTFFKTNGYLFGFKEYDMLMSLPFEPKAIAASKFLYMYIASLPWYVSVSLAMLAVYGAYEKAPILSYIMWLILTLIVPVLPMLFASFIGFVIAKISSGFKRKNIIQTILTFIFVIFCFSLQFIVEELMKNDESEIILENISESISGIGKGYLPIAWFCNAVRDVSISDFLLLVGVTIIVFEAMFLVVGRYYRQINSSLKSHSASKDYSMTKQKKHSVVNAIAFKEYKRLTGSQIYLINGALGEVLALILGVVCLFVNFETIIKIITKNAPFDSSVVYPAIPLIVYFLIGMVATTAISPSIEGKNYWIMQSLPIEKKVIYQGKMLFNMYLTIPFAVFATICMSFSARVTLGNALLYIIEVVALCCFSTSWGCICGMKHMKLDWENEIEVVKQGAAVAIYLFPNMFICMGLVVLVVYLGMYMNPVIISLIITLLALALSTINYRRVIRLADKI